MDINVDGSSRNVEAFWTCFLGFEKEHTKGETSHCCSHNHRITLLCCRVRYLFRLPQASKPSNSEGCIGQLPIPTIVLENPMATISHADADSIGLTSTLLTKTDTDNLHRLWITKKTPDTIEAIPNLVVVGGTGLWSESAYSDNASLQRLCRGHTPPIQVSACLASE